MVKMLNCNWAGTVYVISETISSANSADSEDQNMDVAIGKVRHNSRIESSL